MKSVLVGARDLGQWVVDPALSAVRPGQGRYRLVTVRVDGLGDLILWLPFARRLRDAIGGDQALVVREEWAPLAEALGLWETVVAVPARTMRTSLPARARALKRVARLNADAVLNPMGHLHFSDGEALVRSIDADMKIGCRIDRADWRARLRRGSYAHRVVHDGPVWESDRNAVLVSEVLRLVGAGDEGPVDVHPLLAWARAGSRRHAPEDHPRVVLFPHTSGARRDPPMRVLSRVVGGLLDRGGCRIDIVGDPGGAWGSVASEGEGRLRFLGGRMDLLDLVRTVHGASLVVGGDSAGAHIAAALGVPSVVVLGGGFHRRFFPYAESWTGVHPRVSVHPMECFGCEWSCSVEPDGTDAFPCIRVLEGDGVWLHVEEVLS